MLPGIKQFDLSGRVVIVTGGSKGLGEAMAQGVASAGADVVLVSRHGAEAEAAAQRIAGMFGHQALGIACDVSIPDDVEQVVNTVVGRFGRIDALINNAAINIRGPITELTLEQFQQCQSINVNGPWLCSRAVVPVMRKQGKGRIVNVASTLGLVGLEERTPYTASKGAVVQMTRALALELAKDSITVNAICPGPFLTEMNETIKDSEQARKNIVGATALDRWGELQEIQGVAILLCSDASSYMTGGMITVDGGWTAR